MKAIVFQKEKKEVWFNKINIYIKFVERKKRKIKL